MEDTKGLTEIQKEELKKDILLDIYFYKKNLENCYLDKEVKDMLMDKIREAEAKYSSL